MHSAYSTCIIRLFQAARANSKLLTVPGSGNPFASANEEGDSTGEMRGLEIREADTDLRFAGSAAQQAQLQGGQYAVFLP